MKLYLMQLLKIFLPVFVGKITLLYLKLALLLILLEKWHFVIKLVNRELMMTPLSMNTQQEFVGKLVMILNH